MNLEELKYILEESVEALPGWDSHKKMSPPYRDRYDIEAIKRTNPRVASVMILLYENEFGEIEFPIIMRMSYDGTHSSQFSLPGGQFEEQDISLDQTAIRETVEELGIFEEDITVVKQLSEIFIPPSNFIVYPFVGIYSGSPTFVPQEDEVEYIVPLDLEAFMMADKEYFVKEFSGNKVEIPGYNIGDEELIWGATAMILEEFKDVINLHLNS